MIRLSLLFFPLLFSCALLFGEIAYEVEFQGADHPEMQKLLRSVSQLVHLQTALPSSEASLKRRAEADLPLLKKGLQTLGFYSPQISLQIEAALFPARVIFRIDPGPLYRFASVSLLPRERWPLDEIAAADLCLEIDSPAYPEKILEAELLLLQLLANRGFPLAEIEKSEVLADEAAALIRVVFHVRTGPKALFGAAEIRGLKKVDPCVIRNKIAWREGAPFNPACITNTEKAIEASGLFYSVSITAADEVDSEGKLALLIEVCESKHNTVGLGVNYNTEQGPGIGADWEWRNVRGLGEKVSFRADLWNNRQRGSLLYHQPDCLCPKQDLIWLAEVEKEKTDAFREHFFSLSAIVERELDLCARISYGAMFKQLDTESSNNNRSFSLIKAPLSYRFSNANNLMDPTSGGSLNLRATPSFQAVYPQFTYSIGQLTAIWYTALTRDRHWVLATKMRLGAIFGATSRTIPPPERFYAGNEHTLRGYKYMTVGPIEEGRPVGGRSLMVYSFELRARVAEQFGWVFFYEVGNVYKSTLPTFARKQLQSIGYGIRYHTPVGPLRIDFAVPMNRRGIDERFQLYFSIGQAF